MANQEAGGGAPPDKEKKCFYCGHTGSEHVSGDQQLIECRHPGCDCAFFAAGR